MRPRPDAAPAHRNPDRRNEGGAVDAGRRCAAGEGREDRMNVLVTGVGAPVAVSIFKALRQSALQPRIVATDADPLSVGLFRADAAYVLPRIAVDEAGYLARLAEICLAEEIAMVCFGSEIEMRRVAPHLADMEQKTGARLIVNHPQFVEAFMDKWDTFCLLREKGLPVADSALATDLDARNTFLARHSFPLIVKPRHSSGSKNVFILRNHAEMDFFTQYVAEPVLQEFLTPAEEEYTVGVYKSPRTGYVGQIVLRRSLSAGLTYKAEVVHDEAIESACRAVVEAFDIWGPINIQLRKTAAGVRIFEINLRFSSSAVMRAYFGFNEPELCLRDLILGEPLSQPEVRPGYALRYWDEIYLEPRDCATDAPHPPDFATRGRTVDDF
jgi:carbamoyl-phosphate synthase large subunit